LALGSTAGRLERNPFPASIDVRLRADARAGEDAVNGLAGTLASQPGVSDVRYDRRWLSRLNGIIRFVRTIGIVIVAMLVIAAALTVGNVVRLAAHARRDEIEIMQLVGAPFTYVRGPLVLEGVMQGGAGALVAILALAALFAVVRARYGGVVAEAVGLGSITFYPSSCALSCSSEACCSDVSADWSLRGGSADRAGRRRPGRSVEQRRTARP
jgi:cell division protein FtsX